jgi:hypothetical protein
MKKLFIIPKLQKSGHVKWTQGYISPLEEAKSLKEMGYSYIEAIRFLHDDFGYDNNEEIKEAIKKVYKK